MCVQEMRRHTRPRHCLGLCAPPTGRLPPAAATAKWPCAAPRVSRVSRGWPPSPHGPAYRVCTAGGLAHRIRSLGALTLGPQPSPPRRHILFSRASRSAPRSARAVGEGGRVAGRSPPRPCRPRPGALMGFSMTASGRGPPLFPWSPAAARLSPPPALPARRGFSRAQLEHGGAASLTSRLTPRPPAPGLGRRPQQDPEVTCGELCPLQMRRSLRPSRPLSPTCARKADRLLGRTPPRFVRRAWRPEPLSGCKLGDWSQAGAEPGHLCLQVVEGPHVSPKGLGCRPGGRRFGGPHRGEEPRSARTARRSGEVTPGPPRARRSRVQPRSPPREKAHSRAVSPGAPRAPSQHQEEKGDGRCKDRWNVPGSEGRNGDCVTAANWILLAQGRVQFVGVSATSEASQLLPSHVGGKSVRDAVFTSE